MRPARGGRPLVVTASWAVIGLVVGHVAAYDLIFPDAHLHQEALNGSGHAWLGLLEPSLLIALVAVVAAGWLSARAGQPREARFPCLAVIQVTVFVTLELGERLLAGHALADLPHEVGAQGLGLILLTGVAAQLVTAWLGSTASRAITASARIGGAQPRFVRRPMRLALPTLHIPPTPSGYDNPSRAPPLVSVHVD